MMTTRGYSILAFAVGLMLIVQAIRAYRRGTIEVGEDTFVRAVTKNEKPRRFWFALVANCVIAGGFFAAAIYGWVTGG